MNSIKAPSPFSLADVTQTSKSLVERDRSAAARAERDREERIVVPLERITDRSENTRPIENAHALSLAESIAVLGLIHPIVVDARDRLLAGGHRLAALHLLRETKPESFRAHFAHGIPVRRMAFDADVDHTRAFEVEVAENEHRRDYTKDELAHLVERLRKAGYKDTPGHPREGEKALAPALGVVIKKSLRTVRRILAEIESGEPAAKGARKENRHEREVRLALQRAVGVKVRVQSKRDKSVVVTLFCSSNEELEELMRKTGAL